MILVSISSKVADFLGKLTAVEARSLYLDPHADCMKAIEILREGPVTDEQRLQIADLLKTLLASRGGCGASAGGKCVVIFLHTWLCA